MLATVKLDDEAARQLAEACARKAEALRDTREVLKDYFGNKSRIGTEDVLAFLAEGADEYEEGSKPGYWQTERKAETVETVAPASKATKATSAPGAPRKAGKPAADNPQA
jgi:hypothetical protein